MKTLLTWMLLVGSVAHAKTAPSFRGELLAGGKTSLDANIKKDRLLLVSFWATWCIPCLQELTAVTERLKKDPTIPMDVLTVNIDREERSEIPVTMRQLGFTFPVVLDPTGDIFGKYQKATTLPYSVLLTPNKEIVEEFNGFHENMFDKILVATKALKAPEAAPTPVTPPATAPPAIAKKTGK
jgi:thiol-disulfide isomerase/thioredoxin